MSHTEYIAMSDDEGVAPTRSADEQPIVVLVIGKTGNGKSSLCNTILGGEQFLTGRSMSPTTLQMQAANTNRDDVRINVVDTPDVTNLEWTEQEMQQEVQKWKDKIRDLPYIVLLAVRCDVRYTAEEYAVYTKFLKLWGDNSVKNRLVVTFTFGDRQDTDIVEELKTVYLELQNVMSDAGGRYVVFNNKATTEGKYTAVRTVLQFARSFKQTTHSQKTETSPIASMSHTDYLAMSDDEGVAPLSSADEQSTVALVIGKTGNGKSALCNTILGEERFKTGRSMSSTTLQMQAADTNRDGDQIKVVDTPDVTNLEWTEQEMQQEVQDWKATIRDLPYIVFLAVRCDVRYTAEEYAVYKEFLRLWGNNSVKSRLVVAFTFGDRQDRDIGEELKTVCQELKNVLRDAGGRYVVFNNKGNTYEKDTAVKKVLQYARSLKQTTHPPKVDNRLYAFFGLLVLEGVVMAGWFVLTFLPFELHEEADVLGIFGAVLAFLLPLGFWWKIVKKMRGLHVDKVFFGSSVLNGVVMALWILLTFLPFELHGAALIPGMPGTAFAVMLPLVFWCTIVTDSTDTADRKAAKVRELLRKVQTMWDEGPADFICCRKVIIVIILLLVAGLLFAVGITVKIPALAAVFGVAYFVILVVIVWQKCQLTSVIRSLTGF